MSLIPQSTFVTWFVAAQLPIPKKKENKKPNGAGDTLDPRLQKLTEKLKEAFPETQKRQKSATPKDLSRDPLKTNNAPPVGTNRTPEEKEERKAYIVLTRNPNLPDGGLGANAGLRLKFELERGGHPGKAMPLAKFGAKSPDKGGLSLSPEIGKDGLPTGKLISKDYPGKFILQFQDNSIVVTGRKDAKGQSLPDVTYIKNNKGVYVMDKSRNRQLLWTAPLTEVGAYKLDSNEYTSWLPEQAQNIKGLNRKVYLQPQADGTIYDRTNKRTFIKKGDNWVWDNTRNKPLLTTYIIRDHGLVPLPLMSPWAFRILVNYSKPLPIAKNYRPKMIDCRKHNPDSRFLHGNGMSSSGNGGFRLSTFGYDTDYYDRVFLKSLPPPTLKGQTFGDLIKQGKFPGLDRNGKEIPPPLGPFVQAYKGRDGYYIVTPNRVYLFKDPSTVRGNNIPLVYNFGDANTRIKNKYHRPLNFSEINQIVEHGNITEFSRPELKLAAQVR